MVCSCHTVALSIFVKSIAHVQLPGAHVSASVAAAGAHLSRRFPALAGLKGAARPFLTPSSRPLHTSCSKQSDLADTLERAVRDQRKATHRAVAAADAWQDSSGREAHSTNSRRQYNAAGSARKPQSSSRKTRPQRGSLEPSQTRRTKPQSLPITSETKAVKVPSNLIIESPENPVKEAKQSMAVAAKKPKAEPKKSKTVPRAKFAETSTEAAEPTLGFEGLNINSDRHSARHVAAEQPWGARLEPRGERTRIPRETMEAPQRSAQAWESKRSKPLEEAEEEGQDEDEKWTLPDWRAQKERLKEKFPEGWNPRKKLSPDALAGIRALNAEFPDIYTTQELAKKFEQSPEAIRRILRSKWTPTAEEEIDRQTRWHKRGLKVWNRWSAQGKKPPLRWRLEGIRDRRHLFRKEPLKTPEHSARGKHKRTLIRAQQKLSESMM